MSGSVFSNTVKLDTFFAHVSSTGTPNEISISLSFLNDPDPEEALASPEAKHEIRKTETIVSAARFSNLLAFILVGSSRCRDFSSELVFNPVKYRHNKTNHEKTACWKDHYKQWVEP